MAEARYKRDLRRKGRVRKAYLRAIDIWSQHVLPLITPERGMRMRWARAKMGLSQKEFGKIFGISQSGVDRLENGKHVQIKMTFSQFKTALADHFDYIYHGYVSHLYEPEKPNKDAEMRLKYYNKPHWSKKP